MKLAGQAFQVVAECISRGEHITLAPTGSTSITGLWCPECRTQSAVEIPMRGISGEAVYDLGNVSACLICDDKYLGQA